ncbi:MAG: SAM-dependent methyltransferase, partial [Mesorhizobium sp.]|nr:SAM-dependent methyltransferase [Mesorhizobium sp.]
MLINEAASRGLSNGDAPARADPYRDSGSLEFRFRARRFREVRRLIEAVLAEKGHAEILDLGGTETYWRIGEEFVHANR